MVLEVCMYYQGSTLVGTLGHTESVRFPIKRKNTKYSLQRYNVILALESTLVI